MGIILFCFALALDSLYLQVDCQEGEGRTLLHYLFIKVKLNMVTFLVPSNKYRHPVHIEPRSVLPSALLDKIDRFLCIAPFYIRNAWF